MSLQRYERYKDSGIEWLGEVPEHWVVAGLKRRFQVVGGSTPKSDKETFWDGEIIWVTPADLSKLLSPYISDSQRKITVEGLASCGTTLVPKNSIILSTRAPIGSLAIAETSLCTNQGCKSLVPFEETDAKFYGYLLSISAVELNIRGKGTTFLELSGDELGAFKVPAPPVPEQQTIAAFLDRETAKIDALIAEQQRLIELLKEKRQAVISHTVTKGLNPDAPMKDSGIEWLGEVPEHWECLAVWLLFELGRGRVISHEEILDNIGDFPVYSSQTDNNGEMGRLNTFDFDGDYLTWTTDGANAGTVFRRSGKFNCTNVCGTLKPRNEQIVLDYCVHALSISTASFVRQDINPKLMNNVMAKIRILFPPHVEQFVIAAFLDRETAKIDALTAEAQTAITLLQERRTALISAAVTGKIDVRGLVTAQADVEQAV